MSTYHRMMAVRRSLNEDFGHMEVGMACNVDERIFQDAYPCGGMSMYRTHEECFLSSMVGSAWGVWRVRYDGQSKGYIVTKHEPGRRRYVDPDREHLFERLPDGTLSRVDGEEDNPHDYPD